MIYSYDGLDYDHLPDEHERLVRLRADRDWWRKAAYTATREHMRLLDQEKGGER